MKKILLAILVLIIAVGGYFGYKYYADTYQGVTAYAITPKEVPDKKQTVDDSGNKVEGYSSYTYTFEFVKENGEKQEMTYELSGQNVQPYAPDTLIKAEISKKRIISGPNEVAEKDVPTSVMNVLDAQN
jgi:uncharacterized protein (TIGR01655 family)